MYHSTYKLKTLISKNILKMKRQYKKQQQQTNNNNNTMTIATKQ